MSEIIGGVSFSLVARKGNKVAHYLADCSSKEVCQYEWLTFVSPSLSAILTHDSSSDRDFYVHTMGNFEKEGVGYEVL